MIAVYGDVEMLFERTRVMEFRAVYSPENADFLFYHIHFGCECIIGPNNATSATASVGGDINRLSEIMLQPMQHLTLLDDSGNVIVDSPEILGAPGGDIAVERATKDANNGPHPINFSVMEIKADGSARCYFEVETWIKNCPATFVNEAGSRVSAQQPIIYHRWEESHGINQLLYCTRTVKGEARFRRDVLDRIGLVPDDYRGVLFPFIPRNFQRTNIHVTTVWIVTGKPCFTLHSSCEI